MDVHLQHGPNGDWTTKALIDSGAPITVFDYGTAEALGIRIGQSGHRSGKIDLMGKTRHVQIENVVMRLPQMGADPWETEVAFIKQPDFQMPFQGVLGQEGFLYRHRVTFNFYDGTFEVEVAG